MKKPRYRTIVSFARFQIPARVGNLKSKASFLYFLLCLTTKGSPYGYGFCFFATNLRQVLYGSRKTRISNFMRVTNIFIA